MRKPSLSIIILMIAISLAIHYLKQNTTINNSASSESPTIEKETAKSGKNSLFSLKNHPSRFSRYQLKEIPLEQLSDQVAQAIGLLGKPEDYNSRIKAVNKLGRSLSHTEILALTAFLRQPFDENSGMDLRAFNAIKNDIMTALVEQNEPVPELGKFLVELAQSKELDEVCRDYAVQFFPYVYQNSFEPGAEISPQNSADKQILLDGFSNALAETNTTLAGTALLAVDYLGKDFPELKELNPVEAAVNILDSNSSEPSRITALLIGSKTGDERITTAAREIAQIGESIPLRLAAVNALSKGGNEEDIAILEAIVQEKDKILSAAATRAIKTIQKR